MQVRENRVEGDVEPECPCRQHGGFGTDVPPDEREEDQQRSEEEERPRQAKRPQREVEGDRADEDEREAGSEPEIGVRGVCVQQGVRASCRVVAVGETAGQLEVSRLVVLALGREKGDEDEQRDQRKQEQHGTRVDCRPPAERSQVEERRWATAPCAHRDDRHDLSVVSGKRHRTRRGPPSDRAAAPSPEATIGRGSPDAHGQTRPGGRLAGAIVVGLVVLSGLLAVTLAAGSFLSYETVKRHLDGFASDGDADLTPAEFDSVVLRLRLAAAAAAAAAIALVAGRQRVRSGLDALLRSAVTAAVSLVRATGHAIATESRAHLATLGFVTLVALAVRLEFLFQPMRYDEAVTYVHYASEPWYVALTTYTAPNNHVLHSLLAHVTTLVFGGDPWAVRLPALTAGVALVPASYVAARALYGKHAALLAAALVASSSVLVEFSTNARGYTLLALVFVLLLALATRLRGSESPAEWGAFAILAALGFFAVPVMLYGFVAVVAWLALELWPERRDRIARRLIPAVLASGVLTALLYAPVVAASGPDALLRNEFVRSLPWSTFKSELPGSIGSTVGLWHRDVPLVLVALLAAGFVTGLAFHSRLSETRTPPAAIAAIVVAALLFAQRLVPFERVWLFLVPLYLATAAAGALFLARPLTRRLGGERLPSAAAAALVALALGATAVASQAVYESEDTSTFRDGAAVTELLLRELRPQDKVLVAPPADAVLEYELGRRGRDPAELLYWPKPDATDRFLAVVKEGPDDYVLEHLLADPRLDGVRVERVRRLERFEEAAVYEVQRAARNRPPSS